MKSVIVVLVIVAAYKAAGLEINPIPGGLSGNGTTTRYWDCCKPSCAWTGNLNGTSATHPTRSCSDNGASTIDDNAMSGCADDGVAYMCSDQQPLVYNDTISIGFVAASFTAGADVSKCCSCVLLTLHDTITTKQLVAQITNTGSDLGKNHFDIAMPGGGVGLFNGCTTQWKAPVDGWGERYGGVQTIEECDNLPSQLRPGCRWRFLWFEGADNPTVDFVEIECPLELVHISNCY